MNQEREPLSELLRTWRAPAETSVDDFHAGVWDRIRRSESSGPFLFHLPRPIAIAACWAAVIAALGGGVAAYAYESATRDQRMAAEHARSIDPLQMTASLPARAPSVH